MKNEKEVIEHIKKRYTYDAATGEIRNRKGQVVKGWEREGYKRLNLYVGNRRNVLGLHHIAWALVYGRFPRQITADRPSEWHKDGQSAGESAGGHQERKRRESCMAVEDGQG